MARTTHREGFILVPTLYRLQGDCNGFARHSQWIQDPFLVQTDPKIEEVCLLEPWYFREGAPCGKDRYLARQLAEAFDWQTRSTRFWVEGGNVLAGKGYALAGRDLLAKNVKGYQGQVSPERIEQKLKSLWGVQEIYWIGQEKPWQYEELQMEGDGLSHQAVYHIDLYILAGGQNATGQDIWYVANLDLANVVGENKDRVREDLLRLREALDGAANQLSSFCDANGNQRFEVRRLPIALVLQELRKGVFVSWCNGMADVRESETEVYLPDYARYPHRGVQFLQERVEEQLKRDGIKAHFVSMDFEKTLDRFGALHCRVKRLPVGAIT